MRTSSMQEGKPPLFSIVIPVFNREKLVARAITSCLNQGYTDFEIIVVDDASTDGSKDIVNSFKDHRVQLFVHEVNKGIYPARHTGVLNAGGEWVIFLDSDDELLPQALTEIADEMMKVSSDVDRVAFMYELDTGGFSPNPSNDGEILDYSGYLAWFERAQHTDFLNCIRRQTFARVALPEGRSFYHEALYHFDFAYIYKTMMSPVTVGLIHSDSDNRVKNLNLGQLLGKTLTNALLNASALQAILEKHGHMFRKCAPNRLFNYETNYGMLLFLSGMKKQGFQQMRTLIVQKPFILSSWIVMLFGLLSSRLLAATFILRRKVKHY